MTTPIMTMEKNLTGIDVLEDNSSLITRLYPRGSGSTPSELCLDNPAYFPAAQNLVFDHASGEAAYFRLPNPYSAYNGYTGDGQHLPTGYAVYRDTTDAYSLNYAPISSTVFGHSIAAPSDAIAQMFYMSGTWAIYSVSLWLQRVTSDTPTQWTTQPKFIVGLYSAVGSSTISGGVYQAAGYHVPYQGPQTWCYGNLLSISTDGAWYEFPLQVQPNTWTGWVGIVIAPYPTSNKQWSINDYLFTGGSPSLQGTSTNSYAVYSATGVTPKAWNMGLTGSTVTPYVWQLANQIRVVETDVTSQFYQAYDQYPGRFVETPIENYVPNSQYVFHYQHAPYLTDWDAYQAYGKFEGTYKDDTLTTQAALLAAGSQYLSSYSQPTMTISLGAVDLYEIDPNVNWDDELTVGGTVMIRDGDLDLEQECIITKMVKMDLTKPHQIDTLEMNNVHMTTQGYMAQLGGSANKTRKYQQGQTVETPYPTAVAATSTSPGTMTFSIRDVTTLAQDVRLTVDTPGSFTLTVDGTPLGGTFAGYSNVDIMAYLKQSHNGQPTTGEHTVTVLPTS
jgi:hypothetical protein